LDPRVALVTDIDTQLRHYLGQGVDVQRTLVDTRYARDVLLVCDGMTGTDLPELSRQFREASRGLRVALPVLRTAVRIESPAPRAEQVDAPDSRSAGAGGHEPGPPQGWARNTSGFGHSHPPLADFSLKHHGGERDSPFHSYDRQRRMEDPPDDATGYEFGNQLPWYSWRRWWFTRQI
jgi:hypothetical protein